MGETPKDQNEPVLEVPPMGGAADEQASTNIEEPVPLPDIKKRDDVAIRKAREKHDQLQREEDTRKFMAASKIKQQVVPINQTAVPPAEIASFLQQPEQPSQDSIRKKGPNVIQKSLRNALEFLGIKIKY